MIINVKNVSRSMFKLMNEKLASELISSNNSYCFISIYGTEYNETPPKINHSIWLDGIQLKFDDVDYDMIDSKHHHKVISYHQVKTIISFIKKVHQTETKIILIIHCLAGVSRSAGVGLFVNDILNLNLPNYQNLEVYNTTVYSKLMTAWDETKNESQESLFM